ncbi:MAG TPA: hypothetical protein VMF30_07415 [Pirellulales bacterium]|nr:hypothetical protein [Pirellulales bacterium]
MKRLLLRMTLLSMVVGLGTVVVYEAQRRLYPPETPAEEAPPVVDLEPTPIPLAANEPGTAMTDPYAAAPPVDAGYPPAADAQPIASYPPQDFAPPPRENRAGFEQPSADPGSPAGAYPPAADNEPGRLMQASGGEPLAPDAGPPNQFADMAADPQATDPQSADANAPDNWQENFSPPSAAAQGNYRTAPPTRGTPAYDPSQADGMPAPRGVGRPGEPQLEGAQAPSLTIEKKAPGEIQVGKPAVFTITVRNAGQVAAQGVEVHDLVPQGTELVGTNPQAMQSPEGELIWQLGTLKPGSETTVQMQLMPLTEGEIGSVATLHFQAGASVRTKATKPQLAIDVRAPSRVMAGSDVTLKIKISNPGSGAAAGVVVTEMVPPNLSHPGGTELEFEIGLLKPGESREVELALKAVRPGPVTNVIAARGEANVTAEGQAQFEVVAPELKVAMSGPKRRYLERSAVYTIAISNPGTAPAKDIDLAVNLPKGLKFVEANNAGQFDAAKGTVFWSLEQLPAGETGTVTLTTLPTEPGELHLQIAATAKGNLNDKIDEAVFVEGIAAIMFEVADVNDPVEVGGETTYEVRVVNQGSKASSNVRLVLLLPPELQAIGAEGPTGHAIDGQRVLFEPLVQLAPKADTTYSVKVKAGAVGDLRLRVQVMTDEMRSPVTKEESTHVYADQ